MMLPMFPVLLLIVAVGSVLWYQHTNNDIFWVLAVATAITCLIWGLVIAHWSILLVGLLALLKFRAPMVRPVRVETDNK
ncbi:hypothetical protein Ple7327_1282 [Pleurocapsa sp. PCC 7327]|uniref:hypothetical protein n=1 Tax=Pleurocapsa sp. PCC 7327 TaxID=118163 RepID=UPI00029FBD69|nr:hypothetical protein Ple7327_1282 [Pleurocapsa sp. PCC 7327]